MRNTRIGEWWNHYKTQNRAKNVMWKIKKKSAHSHLVGWMENWLDHARGFEFEQGEVRGHAENLMRATREVQNSQTS